jgi:hypothetical protein
MKILSLRKKIIKNLLITFLLLAAFISIFIYNFFIDKKLESEISKLESEISSIRSKHNELLDKVSQFKKYQEIWSKIPPIKKQISDVKIEFITKNVNEIAAKYSIASPDFKMTIPEELKDGSLNNNLTDFYIVKSSGSIVFNSIDDLKAVSFISELINSMPGYLVIKNFEMKKEKTYNSDDFIKISTGTFNGLVNVKVDFTWYLYKSKIKN